MGWLSAFISTLGFIGAFIGILLGITTIRIIWNSANGKKVSENEFKLASISFGSMGALVVFMALLGFFHQRPVVAILFGIIGSIFTWVIFKITYEKLLGALVANYEKKYNLL